MPTGKQSVVWSPDDTPMQFDPSRRRKLVMRAELAAAQNCSMCHSRTSRTVIVRTVTAAEPRGSFVHYRICATCVRRMTKAIAGKGEGS